MAKRSSTKKSKSRSGAKSDGRKTLVRHGNSLALVIDKQILNQLALDESTPLRVSVAGSGIRVERADVGLGTERTREILQDLRKDKEFVRMMKDLAK
jgi:antitoxin component of MazEF toxin-antitoxin module